MTTNNVTRVSAIALALTFSAALLADSVETKDGSRMNGKVLRIDKGTVTLDTPSAGKIEIKQADVTAIATEQPVSVRLSSGTRMDGRISAATGQPVSGSSGALQIIGVDGTVNTTVSQVSASWAAGRPDPDYDRHWAYEASVDVTGKTGNSEQLGTSADLRATLKSMTDMLQFYTAYNRQITDGNKAADQFKAGVDYSNNFRGRNSWYVRDEGGFDRVKGIDLYNIAAAGYGFDVIRQPKKVLTGRMGLAFRYEGYRDPRAEDVKGMGLDVGLNSDIEFGNSKLVSRVSWNPTFDDFGNFRLSHESYYQVPLAHPAWKLRLGVANDYNSKPPAGIEKLDTGYFTRLVMSWR